MRKKFSSIKKTYLRYFFRSKVLRFDNFSFGEINKKKNNKIIKTFSLPKYSNPRMDG